MECFSTFETPANRLRVLSLFLLGLMLAASTRGADIQPVNSGKVLPPGLPFSEAVRVGDMLYLSGQVGIMPGTMKLAPGGIASESRQTMVNIKTVLESEGLGMDNLVRCLVMLADIAEWPEFNKVYARYFDKARYPARSALAASGLALGARVRRRCDALRYQPRDHPGNP